MLTVHVFVWLRTVQLSVSSLNSPLYVFFFFMWWMRVWDWDRKWLMLRGMLGRGWGRTGGYNWIRLEWGVSRTCTHTNGHSFGRVFCFACSQQRNCKVQTLDVENNLQITAGHRGRDLLATTAPLVFWSLPLLNCYIDSRSHAPPFL